MGTHQAINSTNNAVHCYKCETFIVEKKPVRVLKSLSWSSSSIAITSTTFVAGSTVPRHGKRDRRSPGPGAVPRWIRSLILLDLGEGGRIQEWEREVSPGKEMAAAA